MNTLIRTLKVSSQQDTYVFVTLPRYKIVDPFPIPLKDIQCWFWESEGATLIMALELAEKHSFKYSYKCRMVTLDVHSSLEAVGFMAAVTTRLGLEGLSVNPVSAFYHDHLFVKEEEVDEAVAILEGMARHANAASS